MSVEKRTVITYKCDRCHKIYKHESGEFVDNLSANVTSTWPDETGGYGIDGKNLCKKCSREFIAFMKNKKGGDASVPTSTDGPE